MMVKKFGNINMTPKEMKTDLENNIKEIERFLTEAKKFFTGPEKLVDISPEQIKFLIKETWIDLDPVEWEYVTKVYL